MKQYALYDGNNFVDIGTLQELAKLRGVKVATLKTHICPSVRDKYNSKKKGIFIVDLEELE